MPSSSRVLRGTLRALEIILIVVGCAATPHLPLQSATAVPTETPAPIQLPADDAPHNDLTEWWYYTGHLRSTDGAAYGFEFVIFQVERAGAPVFYAAHYAITDHQRQEFHYDQRTWTLNQPPTSLNLTNGDWGLSANGSSDVFKASMPSYTIQLSVAPTKPPALHGANGVISFGPVGDSYYYSDTRLTVQGTIVDHGVAKTVSGLAWKDRQWGNFLVASRATGGWDWFSVQLADGTDLMLFLLRGPMGDASPAYGTLVAPNGQTESLQPGEAQITATGRWTSPTTGITYPSGWSVNLPGHGLALTLTPVISNQELDARASTGQVYWEGEVTVAGSKPGSSASGLGYVELTGYTASTAQAESK